MKLSIINQVKKKLPPARLQRKNIFQKNRLSLQYFRKCSESADVSIPKVVLALSSLGTQLSKKQKSIQKNCHGKVAKSQSVFLFTVHFQINEQKELQYYFWQQKQLICPFCLVVYCNNSYLETDCYHCNFLFEKYSQENEISNLNHHYTKLLYFLNFSKEDITKLICFKICFLPI